MRAQFKDTALALAAADERVTVLLGDISHFLFNGFQEKYPQRFFNLGICENALISMAAGMSAQGLIPFVHTIAPFLTERSLEQIKLDMAYNGFGGNIVTSGASFDYAWDGATHHCYTDLAILRLIPGLEVMQPGNKKELDTLLRSQYANGNTSYFRLSDHGHGLDFPVTFAKANVLKNTEAPVTVMTAGPILAHVMAACVDLPVNIVYFNTIKPIDRAVIAHFRHTRILVIHDAFGLHEAINEVPGLNTRYYGLPDEFCIWYGTVHDIREKIGLQPTQIFNYVKAEIDV